MRAILSKTAGPPDSLVMEEVPAPRPGPGEVAIGVAATGLNFFDTLIIEDKYQYRPRRPFSPGGEVAGHITEIGPEVTRFSKGDRVLSFMPYGGLCEQVVVSEEFVVAVPPAIDLRTAAALQVTYGTTVHAFRDRAELKPGETVAVLGASGGIGQSAIEIAKIMGARVIACASSGEKLDFCRRYGADDVINYTSEDLKKRLKHLTGGRGVDVVFDVVGGDHAEAALRATGWRGRFLPIGFASGTIPKIPLNLPLLKGCDIRGVFWGEAVLRDPDQHRENMELLLEWVRIGKLRPHIHGVFPLEKTAEALGVIRARKVRGKIIVTP